MHGNVFSKNEIIIFIFIDFKCLSTDHMIWDTLLSFSVIAINISSNEMHMCVCVCVKGGSWVE